MPPKTKRALIRKLRSLIPLLFFPLMAIVLVSGLVIVQGSQNEASHADAIIVILPSEGERPFVEHGLNLYRQNQANLLMIFGEKPEKAQQYLQEQGLSGDAYLVVKSAAKQLLMGEVVAQAYQHEIRTALLVDAPARMLLNLKQARDQGLEAYGAPLISEQPSIGTVLQAALNYWGYLLVGER
jgi:hypothetical protein